MTQKSKIVGKNSVSSNSASSGTGVERSEKRRSICLVKSRNVMNNDKSKRVVEFEMVEEERNEMLELET